MRPPCAADAGRRVDLESALDAAAIRLVLRPYATSMQANAEIPSSGPARIVTAWALLRNAASDTGSTAPKDRNEKTEGIKECPAAASIVGRAIARQPNFLIHADGAGSNLTLLFAPELFLLTATASHAR